MNKKPPEAKSSKRSAHPPQPLPEHPAPEEELGGGDFCSLEEQPSTDDDKPLD